MIAVITKTAPTVEAELRAQNGTIVVVRADDQGQWEPLYGIVDGERRSLPHCFTLNRASKEALDAALRKG